MEHRKGRELTDKQKKWVRERDDERCNFPVKTNDSSYSRCGSTRRLEVHHITPMGWGIRRLNLEPEDLNSPENLITLCHECHTKHVHPDVVEAERGYRNGGTSFSEMFERRRRLTADGIPYWDTSNDNLFRRIAEARTRRKLMQEDWPLRKRRLLTSS